MPTSPPYPIPLFSVERGPQGRAFTLVTLEDLFAAAALAGIAHEMSDQPLTPTEIAHDAYSLAEAMMAERERRRQQRAATITNQP